MTARADNPPPISADEAELHAALVRLLGHRGDDAMRCLRQGQGLGPADAATQAQVQAMTDQTTAALSLTGPWWRREEPRFLDHNGWRTRGELIVWLQGLRMSCGETPEVFASAPRRPGDPLWTRTSRWLAAQLDRLLYEEGIRGAATRWSKPACASKSAIATMSLACVTCPPPSVSERPSHSCCVANSTAHIRSLSLRTSSDTSKTP